MLFFIKFSILNIVIWFTKLCHHSSSVIKIIGCILGGVRSEEQPKLNIFVISYSEVMNL